MDCVFVEGLEIYAAHGVAPAEQEVGRPFRVDLRLGLELSDAADADDIRQTVNYAAAAKIAADVMRERPVRLLESLAKRMATAILEQFPRVQEVEVRITKPLPPLGEIADAAGVEILIRR